MDYHICMYIDIFLSVDSLIFLRMWSIVKSLQRLIFRNGGSSIVLVYTASFFAPSYYSDMWRASIRVDVSCTRLERGTEGGHHPGRSASNS